MFIKLTNASEQYKDQPLVIKKEIILSVYSSVVESVEGDDTDTEKPTKIKTFIYSSNCSWEVQESVDYIFEQLNQQ